MHLPTLSRQGVFHTTPLAVEAAEGQWAIAQAPTLAGDGLLPVLADSSLSGSVLLCWPEVAYPFAAPLLLRLPAWFCWCARMSIVCQQQSVCLQHHPNAVLVRVCRQPGNGTGSPLTNGAYGGFGGEQSSPSLIQLMPWCLVLQTLCAAIGSITVALSGGGGSGAAPGQIPTNAATAGFSGGGGGGFRCAPTPASCQSLGGAHCQGPVRRTLPHPTWCAGASHSVRDDRIRRSKRYVAPIRSGGHGGGTPNSNMTAVCGSTSSTICSTPAASVPSAGGTSFASGTVSSAVFQLGPPVVGPFPPGGGYNTPQNGYVQVARVS